jgi:hypothetical protein
MSAFFCNDVTLTKCVTAILGATERFGDYSWSNAHEDRWPRAAVEHRREMGSAIGRALRRMNDDALFQRYNDRVPRGDLAYEYPEDPPSQPIIHCLKALHCFSYQCLEGNVPETNPLYDELKQVIGLVADSIVSSLPEYDAAPWGD